MPIIPGPIVLNGGPAVRFFGATQRFGPPLYGAFLPTDAWKEQTWPKIQFRNSKDGRKFTVGSNEKCDFYLPEVNGKVVSVVITVKSDGVWLKNAAPDGFLSIDHQEVRPGKELKVNSKEHVEFGGHNFVYQRTEAPMVQTVLKINSLTRCLSCQKKSQVLLCLPCGHVFCSLCVDEFISRTIEANPEGLEHVEFLQSLHFHCAKCKESCQVSDIDRSSILTTVSESVLHFMKRRLVCKDCENWHCATLECEYYRCQKCSANLCPVCALSISHNSHDLVPLTDLAQKKFTEFNKSWAPLESEACNARDLLKTLTSDMSDSIQMMTDLKKNLQLLEDGLKAKIQGAKFQLGQLGSLRYEDPPPGQPGVSSDQSVAPPSLENHVTFDRFSRFAEIDKILESIGPVVPQIVAMINQRSESLFSEEFNFATNL